MVFQVMLARLPRSVALAREASTWVLLSRPTFEDLYLRRINYRPHATDLSVKFSKCGVR